MRISIKLNENQILSSVTIYQISKMVSSNTVVIVVSVVAAIFFATSAGVEDHIDCKKVLMIIAKKQMKVFGICSREQKKLYPDPEEFQKRIQCVVKCSMKKEGFLDENNQVSNTTVQAFLDENVPTMFHELGHIFIDNCRVDFDKKLDSEDKYCVSYGNFIKCMQNNLGDVC